MKKMRIMRGLPGSGKSTACRLRTSDHTVLSTDEYYMVGGAYCWQGDLVGKAHAWNQWRAEQACRLSQPLISIDNTNTTWKEIEPYVRIAIKYGYEIQIVEPHTSWAMDVTQCHQKNTHSVPLESIIKMKERWETTALIETRIRTIGGKLYDD